MEGSVSTITDNCPHERVFIVGSFVLSLLFRYILNVIENCPFLFVNFARGIEHEFVGTADASVLILEYLPVVDFLEEPAEVVVITVWINHRIDKP